MKLISKEQIKKYWYILALIVLALVSIIFKIIVSNLPSSAENSWNGIQPGSTSKTKLEKELGQPIKTDQTENNYIYYYASGTNNWPNKISLNKENSQVDFIEVFFPPKEQTYQSFVTKLGLPNLTLYGPHNEAGFQVFIFLDKGIAIIANPDSQVVLEVWYFTPTTSENFLSTWGKNLTDTLPKQF